VGCLCPQPQRRSVHEQPLYHCQNCCLTFGQLSRRQTVSGQSGFRHRMQFAETSDLRYTLSTDSILASPPDCFDWFAMHYPTYVIFFRFNSAQTVKKRYVARMTRTATKFLHVVRTIFIDDPSADQCSYNQSSIEGPPLYRTLRTMHLSPRSTLYTLTCRLTSIIFASLCLHVND
jgi:hypothetical protein